MPSLPREVAVLGAGTMGAGIAVVFARAGCAVRLCARRESTLESARDRLGASADAMRLTTSAEEALGGAELVVESIAEDLASKRELLALAERVAAPGAVLATNTSSLPLDALAESVDRPSRFAGFHWFNPPELVELVEVVGAAGTSAETLAALAGWAEALGKVPVVLRRDVAGFVANRLQYALLREAWSLVEAGVCSFADVDRAVTAGLGARWAAIGPFETTDLAGLDVHLAVARNLYPELSTASEPPAALVEAVEGGALGCKNGRGLRGTYDPGSVEELAARRERVLRGIAKLRDGKEAE